MSVSPVRMSVYEALRRVPRGRVTTYKALGDAIGCGSPRAIGQALRGNPFAPEVPCHRVIASDISIGGFAGARAGKEIARKLHMLADEGVSFSEGRLVDPRQLFRFPVKES